MEPKPPKTLFKLFQLLLSHLIWHKEQAQEKIDYAYSMPWNGKWEFSITRKDISEITWRYV